MEEYERSGGAKGNTMRGLPVIILTTKGAKTGKIRKTPLMRVEHDGQYAVVASIGGAPQNPVWVYNLRAHPEVELQDGAEKRDMVAREISGDEKARWWEICVAAFPRYGEYQKRSVRDFPVFVLSPKN